MEVTRQGIFPSYPSHIGACLNRGAVGAFRAMEYVKRGAFDCFTVVACENRGAFSCPCVGAYCIRPTNDPPKEGEGPAFGRGQAFAIHGMALCGAYAIRPYPDGRKMIAVGVCSAVLPEKQAAFGECYGVGGGKCGAFSCPRVGAYCILPTNDPPKEGEGPAFGRGQAFAIHGMALCGAYAIRPYPDGRKMIAVGVCSAVLPEKQAAFRGCYGVGGGKCGAFLCPCVGAYCIRPTNVPPKEGEGPSFGRG